MQDNWLETVANQLVEADLDGWLLYDFRGTNPFATRVFGHQNAMLTRRWFLWVPTTREPRDPGACY